LTGAVRRSHLSAVLGHLGEPAQDCKREPARGASGQTTWPVVTALGTRG